jgi:hypothetical protein
MFIVPQGYSCHFDILQDTNENSNVFFFSFDYFSDIFSLLHLPQNSMRQLNRLTMQYKRPGPKKK